MEVKKWREIQYKALVDSLAYLFALIATLNHIPFA